MTICSGFNSGKPGTMTRPRPRCRRDEDRDVPLRRLPELLVIPLRLESELVIAREPNRVVDGCNATVWMPTVPARVAPVPMDLDAVFIAMGSNAGNSAPTGARPQRLQNPWSMVPLQPGC